MKSGKQSRRTTNAVFEAMRLLEKAHIHFYIMRTRPDTLTFVATIVSERIEIDVFEDDHMEISRFRGNEGIEGGRELLVEIVTEQLRENYPEQLRGFAVK